MNTRHSLERLYITRCGWCDISKFMIDGTIDPRDEETSHGVNRGQILAGRLSAFKTVNEGLDDFLVSLH